MKKVKWGVIGAGGIADRQTIPGMLLASNAELVAVMEINMDLSQKLCAKYNAKRAYDKVDALLADPEVEAVYIASPVEFHLEQIIAAANAKKHVLCEKPISKTVSLAQQAKDACDKNGVLSASGFMMRFHAYHQKIKELVSEGVLGDIVSCRCQFTCWYPPQEKEWRQRKDVSGGGALIDMGIHCIDLIEYITGSKTVKVAAFNDTLTHDYNVDDTSSVILKLSNGAQAYIDSNFNIPDDAARSRLELYGTRGSVIAEGTIGQNETGSIRIVSAEKNAHNNSDSRIDVYPVELDVEFGNMYTKEIESFSNSILNGSCVQVPMSDAIWVQKVVDAAYLAGEQEKTITL